MNNSSNPEDFSVRLTAATLALEAKVDEGTTYSDTVQWIYDFLKDGIKEDKAPTLTVVNW